MNVHENEPKYVWSQTTNFEGFYQCIFIPQLETFINFEGINIFLF